MSTDVEEAKAAGEPSNAPNGTADERSPSAAVAPPSPASPSAPPSSTAPLSSTQSPSAPSPSTVPAAAFRPSSSFPRPPLTLIDRLRTERATPAFLGAVGGLASILLTIYLLWIFHVPMLGRALGYDEQFFAWCGWSVLKGLAPYRDFVEYKPPILFLTHAMALKTFGFAGLRFRYFFLILAMTGFTAIQISLFTRGAHKLVVCAVVCGALYLFSMQGFHDTSFADVESIGFSYYLIGIAFLLARTPYRNVTDALGAAFLTICFFTKEPFGPCVGFTWITAFVAASGPAAFKTDFRRYFKYTAIGIGAVILLLCIYMAPTGALTAYVKQVNSYRHLFRDPTKSYCVLLGRFKPTGSVFLDLPEQWHIINREFFNLKTLGFLAPAFVASVVFVGRRSLTLLGLGMATIAGALYAVTASNCYWPHYYLMAMTGTFFFLFLGVDAATLPLRFATPALRQWAVWCFVWTIGIPVYLRYDTDKEAFIGIPGNPEPVEGAVSFITSHSAPEDKIFSTGAPGIYIMANRLHSTRESSFIDEILETLPGDTDVEKVRPLRDQLVAARPKIIFLDPERSERKVRFNRSLLMPFIQEFKYEKMGAYYYVRP